ncbi:ArsR/SmtB family transcription factor [Mesorhizobium sp. 128a]
MISRELASNAKTAAEFLELMGNQKRLLIINHLGAGELPVGVLAEKVQLSQSAVSQHLAKLRAFGLVDARRNGKAVHYFCSSGAARELLAMLDGFLATGTPLMGPGPHHVAERLRRWRVVA